jgi:hypothetical protein
MIIVCSLWVRVSVYEGMLTESCSSWRKGNYPLEISITITGMSIEFIVWSGYQNITFLFIALNFHALNESYFTVSLLFKIIENLNV